MGMKVQRKKTTRHKITMVLNNLRQSLTSSISCFKIQSICFDSDHCLSVPSFKFVCDSVRIFPKVFCILMTETVFIALPVAESIPLLPMFLTMLLTEIQTLLQIQV